MIVTRLRAASKAALIHFLGGMVVAALAASLIFGLWFPYPYYIISGGSSLFFLLCGVDVVCGPLLTLVLYNPTKSRAKWAIDIGLILTVQLAALVYGLYNIAQTRPVWLAFEGDRFRVVRVSDIHTDLLEQAPLSLRSLSWTGPRLVSISKLDRSSPAFLVSVQRALQGDPPSFWPSRWADYAERRAEVVQMLSPLSLLQDRPGFADLRDEISQRTGLTVAEQEASLGYLPMEQLATRDWVVVVRRTDGEPIAYGQVDGW